LLGCYATLAPVISVNKTAGSAVIMYTMWSIRNEQNKIILDHKHSSPAQVLAVRT